MDDVVLRNLEEIGLGLDGNEYPIIKNGGIVVPSKSSVYSSTLGMESDHDKAARAGNSQTGSRKGPSGWEGAGTRRSRPAGEAPSVVSDSVKAQYQAEINEVGKAYPGMQVWLQDDGLWLLTKADLLPGLPKKAVFLTGMSFVGRVVRSWGFWQWALVTAKWIGPRHTNFPDGSICAFEPGDQTWQFGDRIIELLDLYTLWALRQVHLELIGRWPGYQAVRFPFERILELRADEHCGCERSDRLYGDCCRDKDLSGNRIAKAVAFLLDTGGGQRKPPETVVEFVREKRIVPDLGIIERGI